MVISGCQNSVTPEPDWPRGQNFGLGLGFGLDKLASPQPRMCYPMQLYIGCIHFVVVSLLIYYKDVLKLSNVGPGFIICCSHCHIFLFSIACMWPASALVSFNMMVCDCSGRRSTVWLTDSDVHNHSASWHRCHCCHSARLVLPTTNESCSRWDELHSLITTLCLQKCPLGFLL